MKTSSNLNEHSNQLNIPRIVSNKDKHIFIKTSWNRAAGSSFYRSFGLSVGRSVEERERSKISHPGTSKASTSHHRRRSTNKARADRRRSVTTVVVALHLGSPGCSRCGIGNYFWEVRKIKTYNLDWLTHIWEPLTRPPSVSWLQPAAPAVATACSSFFLCESASLPLSANAHIRRNRRLAN